MSVSQRRIVNYARTPLFTVGCIIIVLYISSALKAEPAPPFPVRLIQGDGTEFMANVRGDEYYLHIETVEGYTIIKDRGNWYYAVASADGELVSSRLLVGKDDPSAFRLAGHIERSGELIQRIRESRMRSRVVTRTRPLDPALDSFEKPLTILADFEPGPYQHLYTRQDFYELLFSEDRYPTGSMNDYFQEVSYGVFSFSARPEDVTDWTLAYRSYDYYCNGQSGMGDWPRNSQRLLVDLALILDPVVDFSPYDMDGDGYVDAVTIIVEGGMDGSGDNFLAHAGHLADHKIQLDGVWIDLYDLVYEQSDGGIRPIGTFCHEYGHVLGLPDLYDKDRSSSGIGYWGLMAYGGWNSQARPAHLSAWSKALLGWVTPIRITSNLFDRIIPNSEEYPEALRLWTNGDSGDEYFLIENRQPLGFDENLKGSGLLIWHIDDSQPNNNDENHKMVDLEEADGEDDLDYYHNHGDEGDPFPGAGGENNPNKEFSWSTYPHSRAYDGNLTRTAVKNIRENGLAIEADLYIFDPAAVPALSEWGMLIMGLLLLVLGTAAAVRRRKAVPGRVS